MKKYLIMFLTAALAFNFAMAQKVNDAIEIESGGTWYPGKIVKINANEKEFFVSYDGRKKTSNEWVTKERLKFFVNEVTSTNTGKFKVGDKVEVEYGLAPEPATIIEVGENKYLIKWDKSFYGEKWVSEKEIKKL